MAMEWLGAIQWDHPGIVASVSGAVVAGLFAILTALMKRKKASNDGAGGVSTTGSPEITVAPKFEIDNKPTFNVGLNEKDVGQALNKAVEPLRHEIAALKAELAPKQPVPDSGDPLKVKAVEFFNAGLDAHEKGEVGRAFGHWLDALELDPDDAYVHNNLGLVLMDKNEFDAAIEHFNAALRIDPDDAVAGYNLGVALQHEGQPNAAIEHYNAALRIDPDYANAHNALAVTLALMGELDAAMEHYNTALRIDPEYATAHNNLGNALAAKGELDAAVEHYNAALRIDPEHAAAHFILGCVLAQKNAATDAVAALAKAIELESQFRDRAKTDTDFDSIRDDPAFRKLVYGE